jgi:hypothetical protein
VSELHVYLKITLSVILTAIQAWNQKPVCPWLFLGGVGIWFLFLTGIYGILWYIIVR